MSWLMCFLDTTQKKNFFYQTFLPDYASSGSAYSKEFKFIATTDTGNITNDYGDQSSSNWGAQNGGYFADGTRWKHIAVTFPASGAAPQVYINGAPTNPSNKPAVTGQYRFSQNYGYNVHLGGCRQLRAGNTFPDPTNVQPYLPPVSASIKDFQIYPAVVRPCSRA